MNRLAPQEGLGKSPAVERILMLAAAPKMTGQLRLMEEFRNIADGLERANARIELYHRWAVTPLHLRRAMLDVKPDVVHFAGHGHPTGGIILESESGSVAAVTGEALAGMFSLFTPTVKCVVLNACYTKDQAEAIARHVPFVIGMSHEVNDRAAIVFSVAFYDALARNEPVEWSFRYALSSLLIHGVPGEETPVLVQGWTAESQPEIASRVDWGDAPDTSCFFGRAEEIDTLRSWIRREACKLVAVLGMRGVGKSRLASQAAHVISAQETPTEAQDQIGNSFDFIIWRSLLNAPPLRRLLTEVIAFISESTSAGTEHAQKDLLLSLLSCLRRARCLIILDNFESVLSGAETRLTYRPGYEDYGQLLDFVGTRDHRSCVLLTSRERPPEFSMLEGQSKPVRSLPMSGLGVAEIRTIFSQVGEFRASDQDWARLVELYAGNPLALELVARHILEVYDGVLEPFLDRRKHVIEEIEQVLEWHLNRLAEDELELLYWLAINREAISIADLEADLVSPDAKDRVDSTLRRLRSRLPLVVSRAYFSLQPVLIEFLTSRLVREAGDEIGLGGEELARRLRQRLVANVGNELENGRTGIINRHALQKALAKDYVRESQQRLILRPVEERLKRTLMTDDRVAAFLMNVVDQLRASERGMPGYAAGNLLSLLLDLGFDLTGSNFSDLAIWQAHLQDAQLHAVDFSRCHIDRTTFMETFGNVLCVQFSPRGDLLAASDTLGAIHLWRLPEGQLNGVLTGHTDWIWGLSFSRDSRYLVSASNDSTVRGWDIKSRACTRIFRDGHTGRIRQAVLSPDGAQCVTAGDDGKVLAWSMISGREISTVTRHEGRVWALTISPDGSFVASGGEDGTVHLVNRKEGKEELLAGHSGTVRSLQFTGDGGSLLSASEDGTARIWSLETMQSRPVLGQDQSGPIWAAAFTRDQRAIVTADHDHVLRVWDLDEGKCRVTMGGHTDEVRSLSVAPDGGLIASGSEDATVRLWDLTSGRPIRVIRGYANRIWSLAWQPDGRSLAAAMDDGTCRVWTHEGQLLRTLRAHRARIWSVDICPITCRVATGGADGRVLLWDDGATHPAVEAGTHTSLVRAVSFAHDGSFLVSGGEDSAVRVWDLNRGDCRFVISTEDWISSVAASSTGMLAAAGEASTIWIWDAVSSDLIARCIGHEGNVGCLAFSPDGRYLASAGDDGSVCLWRASDGRSCVELSLGFGEVWAVAFQPTAPLLAIGDQQGGISLFCLQRRAILHRCIAHPKGIRALAFAPDGSTLVAGSEDESLSAWRVAPLERLWVMRVPRPYEGMKITDARGLSDSQKQTLILLGAIDERP